MVSYLRIKQVQSVQVSKVFDRDELKGLSKPLMTPLMNMTAVEMPVPAAFLRPGVNTLEIWSSPRLPVYQDDHAHFESLQLRHLRLITDI